MIDELKPCQCGGFVHREKYMFYASGDFPLLSILTIVCDSCGIRCFIPGPRGIEITDEQWNTRAPQPMTDGETAAKYEKALNMALDGLRDKEKYFKPIENLYAQGVRESINACVLDLEKAVRTVNPNFRKGKS